MKSMSVLPTWLNKTINDWNMETLATKTLCRTYGYCYQLIHTLPCVYIYMNCENSTIGTLTWIVRWYFTSPSLGYLASALGQVSCIMNVKQVCLHVNFCERLQLGILQSLVLHCTPASHFKYGPLLVLDFMYETSPTGRTRPFQICNYERINKITLYIKHNHK